MSYSPDNERGLLGLVTALQNGLDPAVGMQLYGQVQAEQAQAVADRQARLQQYSDLLTGAATSGLPYEATQSLAQALPGRMPRQSRQALGQLYPNSGPNEPQPQYNANDQAMDFPAGSRPTPTGATPINYTPGHGYRSGGYAAAGVSGPQAQSPTYMPDPAMMQAQQEQAQLSADAANWGIFQQAMAQGRARGDDPQTAYLLFANSSPENAALVASDPARVKGILGATFGQAALLGVVNAG
jgi:hypothetical protein